MAEKILNSIIIPAYNEEKAIGVVVDEIRDKVKGNYEIIIVDDGSNDDTAKIAESIKGIKFIKQPYNQGKGNAMKAGVAKASGKNVVFVDADDTYPAEYFNDLFELLKTNDAVFSKRRYRNVPVFNRLGNMAFSYAIKIFWGFGGSDPLSGLYGLSKKYFDKMNIQSSRFSIESEICIKTAIMGLRYTEFPIEYRERLGDSKLHPVKAGWDIIKKLLYFLGEYRPSIAFLLPAATITLASYYFLPRNYFYWMLIIPIVLLGIYVEKKKKIAELISGE